MIIYFTDIKEYINTEHVEHIRYGLSIVGPNNPDRHYIAFEFTKNEYKHVFRKKENYDVAMSKIRDAFKKHKRYIEIDG